MKMLKNLPTMAFRLEAKGDFKKALVIWRRKLTFLAYPGAYVRAAEIARIQGKKRLLSKLILKIHPSNIYEEFGTQLGENLTIEWIKHRGRFQINQEVTSKIVAALWEVDGEILESEWGKYAVAPMQDIKSKGKSNIKINRPRIENQPIFRSLQKKSYRRVKLESLCVDLTNAITAVGSSSFLVNNTCLVDEFREDFPQSANRIDDPLVLGIRARHVLVLKFPSEKMKRIDKAFWLALKYSSEHGHFVSTVLTRLNYFEKHADWGRAPVIISSKLSTTHKGILYLMYPSVDFIEICEGTAISFEKLIVAPTSVFSPTTVSKVSNPPDWVFVDTKEFMWLNTKLGSTSTFSQSFPQKIGIVRNNYSRRKLLDAQEWQDLAVKRGYSLVDPADLTAEEEINLFKNATHIIGEIGSWVYLSGLNPDSQIVILMHDKDFIIWNEISQLNSLRQVKLRIIRGRRTMNWYNKLDANNFNSAWKLTRSAKRKIVELI